VPDEDTSLDPARLRVGQQMYYCGEWNSSLGKPAASAVFADVFFSGGLELGLLDRPLAIHRHLTESAGAVIVRSYRLPGFRVWIPTDSIPILAKHLGVSVRDVPDPRRYDLLLYAFFGVGQFRGADSLRIHDLGGRVIRNWESLGLVLLHVPERSVRQIRSDPRVAWLDSGPDILCQR
jgi:hypothetical protein